MEIKQKRNSTVKLTSQMCVVRLQYLKKFLTLARTVSTNIRIPARPKIGTQLFSKRRPGRSHTPLGETKEIFCQPKQRGVLYGELAQDMSSKWISDLLRCTVARFEANSLPSNWSSQIPIQVELADGTKLRLRLKLCLGSTFGRSEVDHYTRDYAPNTRVAHVGFFHGGFVDRP
jgi:hypothetical protein